MISSNAILPVKVFPIEVRVPVDVPEESRSLTHQDSNYAWTLNFAIFSNSCEKMTRNWADGRKIREELGFWNILPLNLDGQLCLREREIWIQMRCQHQKGKCRTTSLNIRSIEYVLLSSLFVWKKTNQTFSSDLFSLPQPPAILSYTTRLLSQILRQRGSVSNLKNFIFF